MSGTEGEATAAVPPGQAWRIIMLVVMAVAGGVILFALNLTLDQANRQRDRALQLQAHSYEVMILASNLSGTIAHAEASLGRYVVSTDKQFGRRFSDDWLLAAQQITRLDKATSDNPAQQATIGRLRRAFDTRGDELSLTARNTLYHRNDQALALFYGAREAPSLHQISDLLGTINARERRLLDLRSGTADATLVRTTRIAGLLSGFGVLIVLGAAALGWLTVQALAQRASARAEAEVERDRAHDLERAVATATAALHDQEARLRQVQKMQAIGQLTGGIAHDFNNMLAVVLGGLELARRQLKTDPSAVARHIDNATEGAKRAAALTRQLLAFSREETARAEAIEPGMLVAGMTDLLDRTLGDGITVSVENDRSGWMLRADPIRFENALLNLAVNARDAMEGRGTLVIGTSAVVLVAEQIGSAPAGDYLHIAVADSGCGMTPDVIERVFEPFFTTKPIGKGTGLGLSQVFAFVQQAAGEIVIESAPGTGTVVNLYLPRDGDETVAPPISAPAVADPAGQDAFDILVVEDDPRVLAATMGALEELGHRAVACGDPLAAPRVLAGLGAIDLIVSDVLMPGKTGPELVGELLDQRPGTAVLFVTGFAGDAAGDSEFGEHAVLRKPFTITALDRAVRAAVAATPGAFDSIAAE